MEHCYLFYFPKYSRNVLFILLFLWNTPIFAQEDTKLRGFGIHVGVNSGILSGGVGSSFSFHYALRREKVLQLESMLFFDNHSGTTFLSGHTQKNLGLGLTAGTRINILPQKNWNPSLIIMGGFMYSSEVTSRPYESKGVSGAFSLGISNTFYKNHMASIGLNAGENIEALYLKYGLWF